jgi:enoyl-[acyl-carrier protein] reductase I
MARRAFLLPTANSQQEKPILPPFHPPLAVFDTPADVPEDIAGNKRYAAAAGKGFTVSECASNLEKALGGKKIDVLVHSLANGPEVAKPLLETSRNGYLAAVSASSYSYVSMLQRFGPLMNKGTLFLSLFFSSSSLGKQKY